MQVCDVTRQLALPGELQECEETHKRVVPAELAVCAATGKKVLRTRLMTCSQTGDRIVQAVLGRSNYSGKIGRKELLTASAKPSRRVGFSDEFGICDKTKARLLLDELGTSAVSGKIVNKDLLRPSGVSGNLALEDELVTCAESRIRLLPAESGVCTTTKLRVDSRLLARSEVSGLLGLARLMQRCAVTQKLALPSETVLCAWLGKRILRQEARGCALIAMKVAKILLNAKGELMPLRELLDGRSADAQKRDDLIPVLKSLVDKTLNGLRHVWVAASPGTTRLVVCGELVNLFGLKRRYVGLLLKLGDDQKILGAYCVGYRSTDGWVLETQYVPQS